MKTDKFVGGGILVLTLVLILTGQNRAQNPGIFLLVTALYLILAGWSAIKLLRR